MSRGQCVKSKGDPKPENFMETQGTQTEDDEIALKAIREGRTRPPERLPVAEPPRFNLGLFFLPQP
jgi:hypothetical protein